MGKTDLVDLTLSTSGFIKGEKLQNYINRKVGNRPMQQFPIKFAAVATDFESGKPVVFNGRQCRTGRPRFCFDSERVPTCRYRQPQICRRRPVATRTGQRSEKKWAQTSSLPSIFPPVRPKNVSQGMFSYLDQTFNVMSQTALRQELGQANVVIKPQVLELGSVGGFDQKQRAIQLGEQAARAALPEIKRKLAAYQY